MEKKIITVPRHVALVPDGNRRWARKRGFQSWIGHRAGVKSLEKILDRVLKLGISYFTFWGGSVDNLVKRSKIEVKFLVRAYTEQFKKIAKDKRIHQNEVKINVFGELEKYLPGDTQNAIKKAIEATKNYNRYFLNFLLAYNGTNEMVDCIQKIVDTTKDKKVVTKDSIQKNLWTKDLPPVDLLIRTGCGEDPHISAGFMMWDTAYAQLYFTKTFFPAFTADDFETAVKNYSNRERRIGR